MVTPSPVVSPPTRPELLRAAGGSALIQAVVVASVAVSAHAASPLLRSVLMAPAVLAAVAMPRVVARVVPYPADGYPEAAGVAVGAGFFAGALAAMCAAVLWRGHGPSREGWLLLLGFAALLSAAAGFGVVGLAPAAAAWTPRRARDAAVRARRAALHGAAPPAG